MYRRLNNTSDVGRPFNTAAYAPLTTMVAQVTDLLPGDFVHMLGDAHIYSNHFAQAEQQLGRKPKPLPFMKLSPDVKDLLGFKFEEIHLVGSGADASIKAPIAV